MLRKDIRKVRPSPGGTVDPAELERFNRLAEEWRKPDGKFKVIHAFNRVRVEYLSALLARRFERDATAPRPLDGLLLADIGCAAGMISEALAGQGADVTAIDAAERNIAIATLHAEKTGLAIDYRHALPEDLVAEGATFDIVLSLEVVEHVANVAVFLDALAALVKPGGMLVIGTLNRTPLSFLKAIVGAEYVIGWLPKGTHDWRRFVKPAELESALRPHGLSADEIRGVSFQPLSQRWRISSDISATYLMTFSKPPPGNPHSAAST
jgi:2-polyprenyl-6-hydroxyphenyl methylase/3-demethylubiquinone-9 3-methyltransferase